MTSAYPRDACPTCGCVLWPTDGLTPRMRDTMLAIQTYYDAHGIPPTVREIMDMIGAASTSRVHDIVHGLVERGYLSLMPARARSIEILRRVPRPDAPRKRRARA